MTKRLQGRFASRRTAMGVRGPEQIVEVWTDRQGDWTLVITYAGGTSCIVAMGEHWSAMQNPDPA